MIVLWARFSIYERDDMRGSYKDDAHGYPDYDVYEGYQEDDADDWEGHLPQSGSVGMVGRYTGFEVRGQRGDAHCG